MVHIWFVWYCEHMLNSQCCCCRVSNSVWGMRDGRDGPVNKIPWLIDCYRMIIYDYTTWFTGDYDNPWWETVFNQLVVHEMGWGYFNGSIDNNRLGTEVFSHNCRTTGVIPEIRMGWQLVLNRIPWNKVYIGEGWSITSFSKRLINFRLYIRQTRSSRCFALVGGALVGGHYRSRSLSILSISIMKAS